MRKGAMGPEPEDELLHRLKPLGSLLRLWTNQNLEALKLKIVVYLST
jgi:hypothetical protein